jgi:energy-coupling factor transporter ATP-binding protein EcfA2
MAIEIHDLTFSYGNGLVLQGVAGVFDKGSTHVLLGPNGSGKTTLALAIAGVIPPGSGYVRVDGADPASPDFDRTRVQLAFQFPEEQMFEATVAAEIAFGLKNFGVAAGDLKARSEWALGCVGLPAGMLERVPDELSYGEMRKVALASVIALKPSYLLLDEPLAGLDWRGRASVIEAIEALRDEGVTTLLLTHEPDLAAEIGDTVSLLIGGSLRAGPMPTADFFYAADAAAAAEYLPGTVRVLRTLDPSGTHSRPIRDPAVIAAILDGVRS